MIAELFPELQRFPTKNAGQEAWSVAAGAVGTSWRYWAAIAGIVTPSVVIQSSLNRLGIPMAWLLILRVLVVVVTIIACLALLVVFRQAIRHLLWRMLMDQGILYCNSCGYDLRMLPVEPVNGATVCPECGLRQRLDDRHSVDRGIDG